MEKIFFQRRIKKACQSFGFVRRVLCILFLILSAFASDVLGAEPAPARGASFVAASAVLGAVKTPVKITYAEGVGNNKKATISFAYVRLVIAVLFAVIIFSARYVFNRRKGKGRLRVVIEDSETVTEYRETELHDMPRSFAIGDFITCVNFGNEEVSFTAALTGERLYVDNSSELEFFKNGENTKRRFSIIYGDSITFHIHKLDVTIVYLDE